MTSAEQVQSKAAKPHSARSSHAQRTTARDTTRPKKNTSPSNTQRCQAGTRASSPGWWDFGNGVQPYGWGVVVCYIGEASARSGLSIDTIRYYESLGLLRQGTRDRGGRRQFDDEAVAWLVFLRRMRATGMSLQQLQSYIEARGRGADGVAGVLEILRQHQQSMLIARSEIDQCVQLVGEKIAKYQRLAEDGQAPGTPQV